MTWKNTLQWDERLSTRLRLAQQQGFWWRLAALFAHSGDSWFWLPGLFLVWLFSRGDWHSRAALLAIAIFALALLVMVIKFTVKRSRPPGEWGAIYRQTDPHSFPSGHAARAFLLLVMGWALGPTWFALLLTVWAPLVSLSRVATGMHYLSDIVAGAVIGVIAAFLALLVSPLLTLWFPFLF
jgi:undecaprenyl-diphosphatase